MNQSDKATHFKSLHKKSEPLVLYNIWDAGSAKALEDAGAKACATGSWSVAAAQGFGDGEAIPLEFVLQIVERIAKSVDLPLSVDFEGGYAIDAADVTSNVRKIIKAGAIGINFEDQVVGGEGLHAIPTQIERIQAAREAAEQEDVPLFINARTDLFLKAEPSEHAALIDQALERQVAYSNAGADGFFIPGLTQHDLIKRITDAANLPVNVMMRGELNSFGDITKVGASRASYGPAPYRDAISDLTERYNALH
ncbi:isocitrate lyase/PEP mutase family protein [Lentilitoribacter sp. EG35]|uniref:isocitrate lyase/PEP mutase family protein n=1 Tax=Lentilitoribacter sp. EG35 TaxID=3234192 RepID=UPI00345FDB0A